jgi:cytochrome c-type protein NapC
MTCVTGRAVFGLLLLVSTQAGAADVDWSGVPGRTVPLFYPAQISSELLLTQSEHSGAQKFRAGDNCRVCHGGQEKASGDLLVKDRGSEPTPIAGKPGSVNATVKFATRDDRLLVHLEFPSAGQPDAGMDKKFTTKVAMMLDDGKVAEARRAGCWGGCHDDLRSMPGGAGKDTTMYLARSRTRMSRTGGEAIKPESDLAAMRADGIALEYWQARLNPGAPATVVAGTILERRQEIPQTAVTASATFAGGVWSVTMSRPLAAGAPYKPLASGGAYTVAFAIHDGHTADRFHYVSLEHTLAIQSGSGDFVAMNR